MEEFVSLAACILVDKGTESLHDVSYGRLVPPLKRISSTADETQELCPVLECDDGCFQFY